MPLPDEVIADLIGQPLLVNLAYAVLEQPNSTGNDLLKAGLGRDRGSNKRLLDHLCRAGWLISEQAVRRNRPAAVYRVADDERAAALRLIRDRESCGALGEGMRLVAVRTQDLPALVDVLADAGARACIAWLAVCRDGLVGALLALRKDRDVAATVPLLAAFNRAGIQAQPFALEQLLDSSELVAWADRAVPATATPALPSGT